MSRKHGRILVLVLGLALAAGTLSVAKASADIPLIDFCAIAPAATTLNLQLGQQVSAQSGDGSYAQSFCGRYVADITVPAGSGSFSIQGGATPFLSKPYCEALTEYVTIYRRGAFATSFTRVASGTFKGTPAGDPNVLTWCSLTQTAGDPAQPSSSTLASYPFNLVSGVFGGATYRIAVTAKVATIYGQLPVPVSVWAGWPPIPN